MGESLKFLSTSRTTAGRNSAMDPETSRMTPRTSPSMGCPNIIFDAVEVGMPRLIEGLNCMPVWTATSATGTSTLETEKDEVVLTEMISATEELTAVVGSRVGLSIFTFSIISSCCWVAEEATICGGTRGGVCVTTRVRATKMATCTRTVMVSELNLSRRIVDSRRRRAASSASRRASVSWLEKATFGREMGLPVAPSPVFFRSGAAA